MIRANFHTHTTFADGISSAEETIRSAIDKGFCRLGFAEHSYSPVREVFGMKKEAAVLYRQEILRLKERYRDKIEIFLGLELDSYGEKLITPEYIIGSVHYVKKNDALYAVDHNAESFAQMLAAFGSADALTHAYYNDIVQMAKTMRPDIIGHIDLITKFNESHAFFDENAPAYVSCAKDAILRIKPYCSLFEVNTGAIARGCRGVPYPDKTLLSFLRENKIDVIVNSDAHAAQSVDYWFHEAEELLKSCGFRYRCEFNGQDFEHIKL